MIRNLSAPFVFLKQLPNFIFLLFLVGSNAHIVLAARVPVGDGKAVALATQSLAALTGKSAIADVTLTGSVELNGTDAGTGVLKALGTEESRIDLTTSSGASTELRDAQSGSPRGQWGSGAQNAKAIPLQNCQTDAVWFFPALTSLGGRGNRNLKYLGQETHNDVTVEHVRSYLLDAKLPRDVGSRVETLTAVDFYLDAATLLPIALSFNVHPNDDNNVDLLTEIQFSNYQNINGVMVPMKIQKYLQGNLLLDFTVSNVALNTDLSMTDFAVSAAQAGR
jgi:hypothetical protein